MKHGTEEIGITYLKHGQIGREELDPQIAQISADYEKLQPRLDTNERGSEGIEPQRHKEEQACPADA